MDQQMQAVQKLYDQANTVIERLKQEGRQVPGWAVKQAQMAEEMLTLQKQGKDIRPLLNDYLIFDQQIEGERNAFWDE